MKFKPNSVGETSQSNCEDHAADETKKVVHDSSGVSTLKSSTGPCITKSDADSASTTPVISSMRDPVLNASLNPIFNNNRNGNNCSCKNCCDRRSIEFEHMLENRLRHSWTQVRYLVRCAYHGPLDLSSAEAKEFKKCCVDLLVSHDPHLLFCRVESTGREYVNDIKKRLLKQLTNGFNTPASACSFINIMLDEYSHLLNSARTISSLLQGLEENHLSRFNNATLVQHNMHLFQSMVHSEPVIQRTFAEILDQLRQGSAQYDSKYDNVYRACLFSYIKFDTEMTQISVAWRDIQKLIDDFHDDRINMKRNQVYHNSSMSPSEAKEKWNLKISEQEHFMQHLPIAKSHPDLKSDSKLSLTLRNCGFSSAPTSDQVKECNSINGKNENGEARSTSESDPPFDSPANSEGSFSDHFYLLQPPPTSGSASLFSSDEYLRSVKLPAVPSIDVEGRSEAHENPPNKSSPKTLPSDLDGDIDSASSLSPQSCTSDLAHNPFLPFDGSSNNLLTAARPFMFRPFHHAPPYYPQQHLHHLHKSLHGGTDQIFSSGFPTLRPPPPSVRSKTKFTTTGGQASATFQDDQRGIPSSGDGLETMRSSESNKQVQITAASLTANPAATTLVTTNTLLNEAMKDSWSSSSSNQNVDTTTEAASGNGPRHKHIKLKKKVQRRHKGRHSNKKEVLETAVKSKHGDDVNVALAEATDESKKDESDDTEGEEDADDEYDGDEDNDCQHDSKKCNTCLSTGGYCDAPDPNRNYPFYKEAKQPYAVPEYGSGVSYNGPSCECQSCLRLGAVSFFSQPSLPTSTHIQTDANGSALNPHYYNQMQVPDFHPIIHPHLYGLAAVGNGRNMSQPLEQTATSIDSGDGAGLQPQRDLPHHEEDNEDQQGSSGRLLHHPVASSSAQWDMFGKSSGAKLMLNSQDGTSTSLPDWSIAGHHGWLNGSTSGILPSHLVAPGCVSAFQQYINGNTVAGSQGFLQPFLQGTGSLAHAGFHSTLENKGFYNSSAAYSIPSTTSTPGCHVAASDAHSSVFTSSVSPSASSVASNPSSSVFSPASNMSYFPSSSYATLPEFSANPLAQFSPQPHFSSSDSSHLSAMPLVNQMQPIRFHPGTPVNLKNDALSTGTTSGQSVFVTSSPPLQHNPFLPHNPVSSGHDMIGYQGLLPQMSVGGQPTNNVLSQTIPASSAANNLHVRQQILRRKKLVAQSKLSKQVRMQQNNAKSQEQNSNSDGSAPAFSEAQNMHKVQLQLQLTMKNKSQNASTTNSTHATSNATVTSTASSFPAHSTTANSQANFQNNENLSGLDVGVPAAAQKQVVDASLNSSLNAANQASQQQTTKDDLSTQGSKHSSSCQHQAAHGNDRCSETTSCVSNSTTTNTSSGGTGNSNCKYCNCCYCEFYGNGGPPQAPTSKNYQVMRDKLRRKLHTSKQKQDDTDIKEDSKTEDLLQQLSQQGIPTPNIFPGISGIFAQPSVEDLLTFIEGNKTQEDGTKKSSKKTKQKQKKYEKRMNDPIISSSLASRLLDKEIKYVLTYEPGQTKGKQVYPKLDKDEVNSTDNSTTENDVLSTRDAAADKSGSKKRKKKKVISKNEDVKIEKETEKVENKNTTKSTEATASNLAAGNDNDLTPKVQKKASPEKAMHQTTLNPTNGEQMKGNTSKGAAKKQIAEKNQISANANLVKPAKEGLPSSALNSANSTKVAQTTSENAKAKPVAADKSPIPEVTALKTKTIDISSASQTPEGNGQRGKTEKKDTSPEPPKSENNVHNSSDDDLVPALPRKLQKSELRQRRLLPRHYTDPRKMQLSSKESLLIHDSRRTFAKEAARLQQQLATLQNRVSSHKFNTKNGARKGASCQAIPGRKQERPSRQEQQTTKKVKPSEVEASSKSHPEQVKDQVGVVYPGKLNDGDSSDLKKTRTRKQRKKNKGMQSAVGDGEIVDQVFLPREVHEEDGKELDDAEKEIESFKRFCLDSTVLNKPKKISVNWKDFSFKKNQ